MENFLNFNNFTTLFIDPTKGNISTITDCIVKMVNFKKLYTLRQSTIHGKTTTKTAQNTINVD